MYVIIGILSEAENKSIVKFCKKMILQPHVREDYLELLELSLICLGDGETITLRRPGAFHHARWMAKAIYGLKMYIFRGQFPVNHNQLERFVLFIVRIYLKAWYEAPLAIEAPFNDMQFINHLKDYRDKELSETTLKKFKNHLWYLSELNICLAFFDTNVKDEVKRKMVQNLKKRSNGRDLLRLKKFSKEKGLENMVTENSIKFFEILRLDPGFLFNEDPTNWNSRNDYLKAKTICKALTVTNDSAERALGAATDYNKFGPAEDGEKQEMLIAVTENRKNQNNSIKTSVIDYLKNKQ